MSNITTPKLDSFRDLISQAESRHADLSTLGAATRQRDAIKARMSECLDEAEARELIGNLAQAEEIVTIKKIRQPRLQSELSDLLTEAEKTCNAAGSEASTLLGQTSQEEASILDRDDLSKRIEQSTSQHERNQLTQSLAAGGHPLALRNRRVKLEVELRHVLPKTMKAKRDAINAASELITNAAGGRSGLVTPHFARWHYLELAHLQSGPSTGAAQTARLAHLRDTWKAIDFAVASLREIEIEAPERSDGQP